MKASTCNIYCWNVRVRKPCAAAAGDDIGLMESMKMMKQPKTANWTKWGVKKEKPYAKNVIESWSTGHRVVISVKLQYITVGIGSFGHNNVSALKTADSLWYVGSILLPVCCWEWHHQINEEIQKK